MRFFAYTHINEALARQNHGKEVILLRHLSKFALITKLVYQSIFLTILFSNSDFSLIFARQNSGPVSGRRAVMVQSKKSKILKSNYS